MSYQLKDLYSPEFYEGFATTAASVLPDFNKKKFTRLIFDESWEERELKDRMKHTSRVLHEFMPGDFKKATPLLHKLVDQIENSAQKDLQLEFMFIPDYIERFGINHFSLSAKAMERVTQLASCEFAVRPFIVKYESKMLDKLYSWASHKDHRVRRLASEGCRPRLPWAMALPELKKDPSPIVPLLEKLIDDPAEWVRRSVANNLNDISKDNPETALSLFRKWKGKNENVDWVVKHGARTLLKQGRPDVMELFGFGAADSIEIKNFRITTPKVSIGEHLHFELDLVNKSKTDTLVRLEYGVYYLKANGSLSRKVFKISEKEYKAKSTSRIERRQSFQLITTRKYHTGGHELSVIVNGNESDPCTFELLS